MKHQSWAYGGALLLLVPALLAIAGCAKPVFSITERKLCKSVDGSGNPMQETTTFAPADARVCLWFRYRNAPAGQTLKAKFTYTDGLGTESTQEVQTELKGGSSVGVVELTGEDGAALAVGRYTAELLNQSDVSFGPPLGFAVQ